MSCAAIPKPIEAALLALPPGEAEEASEAVAGQLAQAALAVEAGKGEQVVDELRAIVIDHPKVVAARSLLATILVGDLEARALDQHRRTKSRPPEERINAIAEAELLVRAGLVYAPDDARLHALLARVYEVDGHLEAALAAYREAHRREPGATRTLLSMTRLELELGEERAAVFHLEALRSRIATVPIDVLFWEVRCYMALYDTLRREAVAGNATNDNKKTYLDRARRAYDELASRSPDDARASAGSAFCRFRQLLDGDRPRSDKAIREVLDLYREAARLAPTDALRRFDLGVVLESELIDDPAAAALEYRSALARDPEHIPSALNLARLLWAQPPTDSAARSEARKLWSMALPRLEPRERRRVEALLEGQPPA